MSGHTDSLSQYKFRNKIFIQPPILDGLPLRFPLKQSDSTFTFLYTLLSQMTPYSPELTSFPLPFFFTKRALPVDFHYRNRQHFLQSFLHPIRSHYPFPLMLKLPLVIVASHRVVFSCLISFYPKIQQNGIHFSAYQLDKLYS